MISFVVYFSTAQDQVGYVGRDGRGTVLNEFTGGPALGPGLYCLRGHELTLVLDIPTGIEELADEDEESRQWAGLSRAARNNWMAENPYE